MPAECLITNTITLTNITELTNWVTQTNAVSAPNDPQLWFTGAGAVISLTAIIVSGCLIYRQVAVMKEQTKISERQAEFSQWQYKDAIRDRVKFLGSEMTGMIESTITHIDEFQKMLFDEMRRNPFIDNSAIINRHIGGAWDGLIPNYWNIINNFKSQVNGCPTYFEAFFNQIAKLYSNVYIIDNKDFVFNRDSCENNISRYYDYCSLAWKILSCGNNIFGNFLYTYITGGDISNFQNRINELGREIEQFKIKCNMEKNNDPPQHPAD